MKKIIVAMLLASAAHAGDFVTVSSTSIDVSVPATLHDVPLLLSNPTTGEHPNLATWQNPNTGFGITSGDIFVSHQGTADFSFSRDTWDGAGVFLIHNATRQEPLGNALPVFSNEIDKDGIFWIDNRAPDGVSGRDPSGRSLLFDVGRHYPLRVGYDGIDVTTATVTAIKFRDGTIMTTVPTGGGGGGGGSGCADDGPLASAPSSPGVCESYFNTTDHQKYMWNGSAWVILG